MENNQNSKLSLPAAIIVAGLLIAGAIFINKPAPPAPPGSGSGFDTSKLAGVKADEHILGAGPANKIFIVEFSDLECPFCKLFHKTMHQVVSDYGGKVAWVYRYFPLSFHTKSPKEAEAAECAAQLGGNDGFWKYVDRVFEVSPTNNGLDPAELYTIASYAGLDSGAFRTCLDSGRNKSIVDADIKQGTDIGIQGTPTSFIVSGKTIVPIEGAAPYEEVKAQIDKLLK
jgi:protein-disulfide isomerase